MRKFQADLGWKKPLVVGAILLLAIVQFLAAQNLGTAPQFNNADTVPTARTSRTDGGAEASPTRTRRSRTSSDEESGGNARYFLAKTNGNDGTLAFDREMASEGEALVEALRLGVTYYEVQEYRVVPDFSGRKPLLGKEAVKGK